jgi:hypothetical protein
MSNHQRVHFYAMQHIVARSSRRPPHARTYNFEDNGAHRHGKIDGCFNKPTAISRKYRREWANLLVSSNIVLTRLPTLQTMSILHATHSSHGQTGSIVVAVVVGVSVSVSVGVVVAVVVVAVVVGLVVALVVKVVVNVVSG